MPPLEGNELLEKFLLKTSQLEVLKQEWGAGALAVYAVSTQQQCQLLEEVYTDKVLNWAKKAVAKQQSRDLARMQLESVSTNVKLDPTRVDSQSSPTTCTVGSIAAVNSLGSDLSLKCFCRSQCPSHNHIVKPHRRHWTLYQ